jgi:hypothetical protein
MGLSLRSIFALRLLLLFGVACLGQLVAGCSSVNEDTPDHLDFALPTTTWTVSPDDPRWHASPAPGTMPSFVCAGPEALATDCCAEPWDCQRYPLTCNPATNFCALTFAVQVGQTVDLGAEIAAVTEIQSGVFSKVTLLSLTATVEMSSGLPIRSAGLFIGPAGLADSSDPAAMLLVPIGLAPEPQPVTPAPAARDAFSSLARNYQRPFCLLLSTQVVIPDRVQAEGALHVTLEGQLRAYY